MGLALLLCHFSQLNLCRVASAQESASLVQRFQETLVETIERAEPSVVAVAVFRAQPEFPLAINADLFETLFSEQDKGPLPSRFGAGVIIDVDPQTESVFVLTNAHLVDSAIGTEAPNEATVAVRTQTLQTFRARIHALDVRSDLAVLRLEVPASSGRSRNRLQNFHAVKFGEAEVLKKGSLILAFGNPWGLARDGSCSVSLGMVSNQGRSALPRRGESEQDQPLSRMGLLLEADIEVEPGLSGGALLDVEGQFVGLITALSGSDETETSAVFALPMTKGVRRIIDELRNGYEVEYGFLGVQPETVKTDRLPSSDELAGRHRAVQVGRVAKNSPAERVGLTTDDVVLSVNGTPLFRARDLTRETALLGPGVQARLKIYRPETRQMLELSPQLGKLPVTDESKLVFTAFRDPLWRGLRVDYPTARRRYLDFFANDVHGVLVREVVDDSPAAVAGLKVGEFIVKVGELPVETPKEFREALEYWPGSVPITLQDGRELMIPEQDKESP